MKYLKQFIIGSSYPVFFSFYYSVKNSQPKKTYKYYDYTLAAPVWFGVWNIISLILAERLNLTINMREANKLEDLSKAESKELINKYDSNVTTQVWMPYVFKENNEYFITYECL